MITKIFTTDTGRYKSKSPEGFADIVKDLPLKIEGIDVKGKFMWWTLKSDTKVWYMWCTYGMSGQWSRSAGKHTAFIVEHNLSGSSITRDQQKIFFNDIRRFGTLKFVNDEQKMQKKLRSLGPDVLEDPPVSPELFAERILQKPSRSIAEALMDQNCISGVGNYLKSEILYRSKVYPHRVVCELTSNEITEIWAETILASRESYADQGASIRSYKTVDDQKGNTQFQFRVYGKQNCPEQHAVQREQTSDGRTSWWCNICQK